MDDPDGLAAPWERAQLASFYPKPPAETRTLHKSPVSQRQMLRSALHDEGERSEERTGIAQGDGADTLRTTVEERSE
jgi:hypothetical protein